MAGLLQQFLFVTDDERLTIEEESLLLMTLFNDLTQRWGVINTCLTSVIAQAS